jgi:hypothetical protein
VTYTQIGILAVAVALVADLVVFRTRLVTRKGFWLPYAIIVFFQLVTNGVLTGFMIVRYNGSAIIGGPHSTGTPPFIGDGRLVYAPVEDLMFGFAMVLGVLVLWIWLGRRGVQPTPYAGPPPRWWPKSGVFGRAESSGD